MNANMELLITELSRVEKKRAEKIERILAVVLRMDPRSLDILWKTAVALIRHKK